jgi:hypothetical protein
MEGDMAARSESKRQLTPRDLFAPESLDPFKI